MKKKYVVDTSVFLAYAVHNKMYRLINAFKLYRLEVFINDTLLAELERNLVKLLPKTGTQPQDILEQIETATTFATITPSFTQSPDPKDNFLFDLALQTSSEVIVTQEKALLRFTTNPVAVHDLKWFKENYPVPL